MILPPEDFAGEGIHPRYHAIWRRYCYSLFCSPVRNPTRERYAWRIWPAVDLDRLELAASRLIGENDFGAFGTAPHPGGPTVRNVMDAHCEPRHEVCVFEITANAFLFRMVRRIVSLLVNIGQGLMEVQMVDFYLQSGSAKYIKSIAPANGLSLVEVGYGNQF